MNQRLVSPFLAATALLCGVALAGCSKPAEVASTAPAASMAGTNIADVDVTEHVTTALRQSETLKAFDIQVVTLKGDVRLNGMLDSQAQIDEALRIARAAEGAHAVHNELTLKK
jgi:hyperosmotically inducible periplasmic protein